MDEAGRRLASRRLPEGLAGIRQLHELIAAHAEEPDQAVIGIETDRGLWVAALIAAGYQLYAVNPLAVARYRDRHHVSGAKSDASDAKLLADLVRTDRHNHRLIAGDSADAEAIKVLARAHQSLIWARNRHTNALRNALHEYYPAALVAFEDLAHGDTLGVLDRAPTPQQRAHLPLGTIQSALKRGGRQRNIAARARQIQAALRSEQLVAPAPVTAAFAATTRAAVGIIAELNRQISELEATLAEHFEKHRTPTSTSPSQDSVSSSAPGCSVSSGTTRTDTPTPSLAKTTPEPHHSRSHPVANAPCWPATCATAASMTPSTNGHSALPRPAPVPAPSTTSTAPPATPTTKPYAPSATASWASCTAAYATTRFTTNTPPGTTEPKPRLDNLRTWDV